MEEQPKGERNGIPSTTVSPAVEATLLFATALVQDGMSGVTVLVPRAAGVLPRARDAAQRAGVSVRADNVGSAMITMRFSGSLPALERALHRGDVRARARRGGRQGWHQVVDWLVRRPKPS